MSKRARPSIVALARGVRRELREKDIAIDARGRARKQGKFITFTRVARAVGTIKRAIEAVTKKPRAAKRPVPSTPTPSRAIKTPSSRDRELATLRERAERAELALQRERALKKPAKRAPTKKKPTKKTVASREVRELREKLKASEKERVKLAKALATPPPPPTPPAAPPAPPEKPERPKKGKKKAAKEAELTDTDHAILASWDALSFDQKQEWLVKLTPAGRAELERRTGPKPTKPVKVVAAKSPDDLRRDLEAALQGKGVKNAIAKEVDNRAVRKVDVTAWKDQYRASMRKPRLIVQNVADAQKAAKAASYPKRQKGTRYHATIIAITQHPPIAKYGPSTITGHDDLFVIHIAAEMASSPAQMKRNIALAISRALKDLPGGAPMYIAAIEVRTSKRSTK